MKVFNVDEFEWYAGRNLEEVEEFVKESRVSDGIDDEELDIIELTEVDLDKLKFYEDPVEEEGETITFRERLDFMIEQKEKFPCFFATSEF